MYTLHQGCIGRRGGTPLPPRFPEHSAYAQPLSLSRQAPASMASVTDRNRPPTALATSCLTTSGAASVAPSLSMHPCPPRPPCCEPAHTRHPRPTGRPLLPLPGAPTAQRLPTPRHPPPRACGASKATLPGAPFVPHPRRPRLGSTGPNIRCQMGRGPHRGQGPSLCPPDGGPPLRHNALLPRPHGDARLHRAPARRANTHCTAHAAPPAPAYTRQDGPSTATRQQNRPHACPRCPLPSPPLPHARARHVTCCWRTTVSLGLPPKQRIPPRKGGRHPMDGREENCSAGGGDTEAHFSNPPPPLAGVHVTPPTEQFSGCHVLEGEGGGLKGGWVCWLGPPRPRVSLKTRKF